MVIKGSSDGPLFKYNIQNMLGNCTGEHRDQFDNPYWMNNDLSDCIIELPLDETDWHISFYTIEVLKDITGSVVFDIYGINNDCESNSVGVCGTMVINFVEDKMPHTPIFITTFPMDFNAIRFITSGKTRM